MVIFLGEPMYSDQNTNDALSATASGAGLTLRDRIQAAVNRLHTEMDFSEVNSRVMSPEVTILDYRRFLAVTYGFTKSLESCISEEWILNELAARSIKVSCRTRLLEQDLETVGLTIDEIRRLPRMPGVPAVRTLAQAMGILYTLEGSTLGGLTIGKHIAMRLKLDARAGIRFLFCHGSPQKTVEHFHDFLKHLNSFTRHPEEADEAISSAVVAFELIKNWLDQG